MFHLLAPLGVYALSLLGAVALRRLWVRRRGRRFLIPYDRMPIGIALVLLVAAAGALVSGNQIMANDFAIMAYYLLVLGVGLQILTYIRAQRGRRSGVKGEPQELVKRQEERDDEG